VSWEVQNIIRDNSGASSLTGVDSLNIFSKKLIFYSLGDAGNKRNAQKLFLILNGKGFFEYLLILIGVDFPSVIHF